MSNVTRESSQLQLSPVTGKIGAEVSGIQLSGNLDASVVEEIHRALLTYKVLFFRGQHLDDAGQEAFAAQLGKPFAHPTVPTKPGSGYILELDSHHGGRATQWHTDVTFLDAYPKASILRGVVIPDAGGDTVWSNTVAAYESLTPELKDLADRLWSLHSNAFDYAAASRANVSAEEEAQYRKVFSSTVYETEHPVVRVHPETGEKSLLLGSFVKRILGVSASESIKLYEIFQEHVTRLENTVRWRWQEGDIVIWDNRATQHIAINDYGDAHRVVRRVTLEGDVPVAIDGSHSRTRYKAVNE
ncbi:TauD/TfdA family dioxygenase [Paenibacillus filicis]|uniref:TauD/TfdA family dioxygenase n=1 Tax=Paenibacillus filicis TaxID=669464 RepID=A0ABU9DD12_9BACL